MPHTLSSALLRGRNLRFFVTLRFGILSAALVLTDLHAEPRTSASYTISADTLDAGGGVAASAAYTDSASTGAIAGISTAGDPAYLLKAGYLARIYDVTALQLVSPVAELTEGGTLQMSAMQVLDDATTLILPAASIAWGVSSGPLAAIGASGLASAGNVYEDTLAVVSGSFGGFISTRSVTVRNVNSDNFGTYGSDGLPDGWQVQYFGMGNPNAAPAVDASGTGQTNLFKYTAGLDPIDPASRFTLEIESVEGFPAEMDLTFTPVFPDRTYHVEYTTDLALGVWSPLPGALENTVGELRTVTDSAAVDQVKFYRVRITKP